MRTEPPEPTQAQLGIWLTEYWGLTPTDIRYAPVGFGSHHWIASDRSGPRWFVTADFLDPDGSWMGPTPADILAGVIAAAESTAALAADGIDFLVPPLPRRDGRGHVLHALPDWTVYVLPHLDGWSTGYGAWKDPGERAAMAELLGRLHAHRPPSGLRRWSFAIPARDALTAVLDELDRPWTTGPYAEPTRELLAAHRSSIEAHLSRYDTMVAAAETRADPWVVTHGEPHSGNVIRTPGDATTGTSPALRLIDFDSMLLAPRERDLAALFPPEDLVSSDGPTNEALARYAAGAGAPVAPHPEMIALFHAWWVLSEICGYVQEFSRPHDSSPDTELAWESLQGYVLHAERDVRLRT